MRKSGTFVLFALIMVVQGAFAWWAAAIRGMEPVILSFGAAFAAFGLHDKSSHETQHFSAKEWIMNKKEKVWSNTYTGDDIDIELSTRGVMDMEPPEERKERILKERAWMKDWNRRVDNAIKNDKEYWDQRVKEGKPGYEESQKIM